MRLSTPEKEGVLRVSKALKHQVLLDYQEMKALFKEIAPVAIYNGSEPVSLKEAHLKGFLIAYKDYITGVQKGKLIDEKPLRPFFSGMMTATEDDLYAQEVAGKKVLIRPIKPVVQLQAHHFYFDQEKKKFHPLSMGKESISWGIQFSYPQLFQDPHSQEVEKVNRTAPNTELFKKISKWMRANTLPTPFEYETEVLHAPIRIGKKCLEWINTHPQLKQAGLSCHLRSKSTSG